MKYKTAFRLAVRAIGILLIGYSLPCVAATFGSFALDLLMGGWPGPLGSGMWEFQVWTSIEHLLMTLVGLYLFFGGKWIVNRAIPSNRPYCTECAYELTGLPAEGVCPECGTAYRRPARREAGT